MLLNEVRQMLTATIIPFWRSLRDDEHGGYYGWVDFELQIDKQAEKGCILNSRILWFFSCAAKYLQKSELLDEARHAYAFMLDHCIDREYGGVYWSVSYDGSLRDTTKHTYNQAFAVYALAAYYDASGEDEALEQARELYRLIEEKCTDDAGFGEAYDRRFCPILNEKLSENGILADRTMNTLLHVFEGYAGLQQAAPSLDVERSMRRILQNFKANVYNPERRRQEVFFDSQMRSIIDLHSYGHDIEASWLIDWGVSLLGDDALACELGAITSELARNVYTTAYHKHSVWNERENGVDDKSRVWWVQAEAMVGFLNEYQKHPEEKKYLDAVWEIWDYIKCNLVDERSNAEWYWDVDDDGRPNNSKPIVGPWKCPYHNGRMCFELLRRNIDAAPGV